MVPVLGKGKCLSGAAGCCKIIFVAFTDPLHLLTYCYA